MPKFLNLARVYTSTTGNGTITLGSAVDGFLTFAEAGAENGDVIAYAIADENGREIGVGSYSSTGPTLTRNVFASSSGGDPISLGGAAEVFSSPSAEHLSEIFMTLEDLPDRSNHTGTQAISTVSGLQTALDGKANLVGGNAFTGPQRISYASHSIGAATLTLDLANNNGFIITMSGNPTIANPSGIASAVGQEILIVFRGAYQPSFGSYWKFPGGEAPTFDGSLNAIGGTVISSTEILVHGAVGYA